MAKTHKQKNESENTNHWDEQKVERLTVLVGFRNRKLRLILGSS
jgi:hypothetical protein